MEIRSDVARLKEIEKLFENPEVLGTEKLTELAAELLALLFAPTVKKFPDSTQPPQGPVSHRRDN